MRLGQKLIKLISTIPLYSNHSVHDTGLAAFDLPLPFIKGDKFNQPIFGCNNLSGELSNIVPDDCEREFSS